MSSKKAYSSYFKSFLNIMVNKKLTQLYTIMIVIIGYKFSKKVKGELQRQIDILQKVERTWIDINPPIKSSIKTRFLLIFASSSRTSKRSMINAQDIAVDPVIRRNSQTTPFTTRKWDACYWYSLGEIIYYLLLNSIILLKYLYIIQSILSSSLTFIGFNFTYH